MLDWKKIGDINSNPEDLKAWYEKNVTPELQAKYNSFGSTVDQYTT
jgi:hypothetical protein